MPAISPTKNRLASPMLVISIIATRALAIAVRIITTRDITT